jgi:hypothetical protein
VPAEQVHEVPLRAGDAKLLTFKRTL